MSEQWQNWQIGDQWNSWQWNTMPPRYSEYSATFFSSSTFALCFSYQQEKMRRRGRERKRAQRLCLDANKSFLIAKTFSPPESHKAPTSSATKKRCKIWFLSLKTLKPKKHCCFELQIALTLFLRWLVGCFFFFVFSWLVCWCSAAVEKYQQVETVASLRRRLRWVVGNLKLNLVLPRWSSERRQHLNCGGGEATWSRFIWIAGAPQKATSKKPATSKGKLKQLQWINNNETKTNKIIIFTTITRHNRYSERTNFSQSRI